MAVIRGNIEALKGKAIYGWVADETDWAARLEVSFTTRRGRVVHAMANQPREDLLGAGIGTGQYGYVLHLPWPIELERGPGLMAVTVRDAKGVVIRQLSRPWSDFPPEPLPPTSPPQRGRIEGTQGGLITGWIAGSDPAVAPFLTLDGRPLPGLRFPVEAPGGRQPPVPGTVRGFSAEGVGLRKGSRLGLHLRGRDRAELLDEVPVDTDRVETGFIAQLETARRIAARPGSIAITCWDGAHNPVGRAKVLFDVAAFRRPAIILCYLHRDFGGTVWPPLLDSDAVILTIPWEGRARYEAAIRQSGLRFDTVWISKARLASFRLAALVSHPETALMLDFDDNEDHFSRSQNARDQAYGQAALNLSARLTEAISARTAASITLCEEFGALMLRHVRAPSPADQTAAVAPSSTLSVGFVGTVRRHKRLVEAAGAVQAFSALTGIPAQLHVRGDIRPEAMVRDLEQAGAVVGGEVPMAALPAHLRSFDVVLSGYPGTEGDHEITRYQISSKIGDALAAGKSVMVPNSPSVRDLDEVPGVFLFTPETFGETLMQALSFAGEIALPVPFTVEGAQETLDAAEALARAAPRAGQALAALDYLVRGDPDPAPDERSGGAAGGRPTVVLLWKQNDSGLYGRRVDQIARHCKAAWPDHRILVLDLMHAAQEQDYRNSDSRFLSDYSLLLDLAARKRSGYLDRDRVEYRQIAYPADDRAASSLEAFLLDEGLLPVNTVFVLFPILYCFDQVEGILAQYPRLVDVVDNQVLWGARDDASRAQRGVQYQKLLADCGAAVFNSQSNLDFFRDAGFLGPDATVGIIPNWYRLPAGARPGDDRDPLGQELHLLYSGNMNDRIDWTLMAQIAELSPDVQLHLVGTAAHSMEPLLALLTRKNVIYHGPLSEGRVIGLSRRIDAAIMPHLVDNASTYMNPLKVHMFAAIGLPVIASRVPGLEPGPAVTIAEGREDFLSMVRVLLGTRPARQPAVDDSTDGDRYVAMIAALREGSIRPGATG